jgi:hypothetical protein
MKTLAELNAELDALNATMNDETDDSPEILAAQERLFAEIAAAEAADLPSLSAKELTAHFQKCAPGVILPKGLAKAAIIKRIEALDPLPPLPPASTESDTATQPEATPAAEPAEFSVAAYARQYGLDGRELRKQLRAAGLRAPYTVEQVEKVIR